MTFFHKTTYYTLNTASFMKLLFFTQILCVLAVVFFKEFSNRLTQLWTYTTAIDRAHKIPAAHYIPLFNKNLYKAETGLFLYPGSNFINYFPPIQSAYLKFQEIQQYCKASPGFRIMYAKLSLNGQSNCNTCFWQTEAHCVN